MPVSPLDRVPRAPAVRELRVFAFDPSLSGQFDTWEVNETVLQVRWEGAAPAGAVSDSACDRGPEQEASPGAVAHRLLPGPVGEYVEVVDVDPASQCAYAPVDLNHPHLLAAKGLDPSDGDPQFHQQMVYAVAMYTIQNFERALGRPVLWAPRDWRQRPRELQGEAKVRWEYVPRLRIYPHALREANAFYSPEKKALLFGYFPAPRPLEGQDEFLPGGMVFSCLSQDIVAHETTHALLDGMHRRLIEPTSLDTLAFHEAFADIVALFQHFTLPGVLRHQIARTRGDLRRQNLLGQLAQQFGTATGGRGALRDALGEVNKETGVWQARKPDPTALQRTREPHSRGSILVGAVFDAFLSIYQSRVADLLRLATQGTGVLPEGAIHPDLVNRLSGEAARAAGHVLTMCIRALDYIPPTDFDFGEYLRALITADTAVVPKDSRGYRVAIVEAFRRRGIYPRGVRTLGADSLLWECPTDRNGEPRFLTGLKEQGFAAFRNVPVPREQIHVNAQKRGAALHNWLIEQNEETFTFLGLRKSLNPEVHSVRLARRVGADGDILTEMIVQITQWRPGFLDPERQKAADERGDRDGDFVFRGGCTLVVDPDEMEVKYCVRKHIDDDARLERQRRFLAGEPEGGSLRATYFGGRCAGEPFAMLHRSQEEEV